MPLKKRGSDKVFFPHLYLLEFKGTLPCLLGIGQPCGGPIPKKKHWSRGAKLHGLGVNPRDTIQYTPLQLFGMFRSKDTLCMIAWEMNIYAAKVIKYIYNL